MRLEPPLRVEIIALALTAFYHCMHCEVVWYMVGFDRGIRQEQAAAALPADVAWEYQAVSDWVGQLLSRYRDRVVVQVIDAATLPGFWKTLRYRLRRYPAVVVGGKAVFTGTDFEPAEAEIARQLAGKTVSS